MYRVVCTFYGAWSRGAMGVACCQSWRAMQFPFDTFDPAMVRGFIKAFEPSATTTKRKQNTGARGDADSTIQ
jgi:hypothetical protein